VPERPQIACASSEDCSPGIAKVVSRTPRPGDFVMMLDGEGRPRFIWRTTEIKIKPLSEVDEAFAWDEGEGGPNARLVGRCPSPLFRSASGA